MSGKELANNTHNASVFITEELLRSGNGSSVQDPGNTGTRVGSQDLASLRKRFKFLEEFSDEFVRNTPFNVLLKAEVANNKLRDQYKGKEVMNVLASNRDNLGTMFINVAEGKDNRWDSLHSARFLPGAGCQATKIWLRAREVMGSEGHTPIATYDMGSVGLAGYVTPRGWAELHDVGSPNLALRLFSINNCGKRACTKTTSSGEDSVLAEIEEIGEFKLAVRVLREAMGFVHPWNKSISALEGFLHQTNYCATDLEGLEKTATLLTQFVDYVLDENANRWKGQEAFLTTGQLRAVWDAFFGARPQSMLSRSKASSYKAPYKAPSSQQQPQQSSLPFVAPRHYFFDDICVMWNLGKCTKPAADCKTKKGTVLRHVCNYRADPKNASDICLKNHAATYFHK